MACIQILYDVRSLELGPAPTTIPLRSQNSILSSEPLRDSLYLSLIMKAFQSRKPGLVLGHISIQIEQYEVVNTSSIPAHRQPILRNLSLRSSLLVPSLKLTCQLRQLLTLKNLFKKDSFLTLFHRPYLRFRSYLCYRRALTFAQNFQQDSP